ncbi:dipeptide ABC transporter ATP-binding protein [Dactylosporangium sp. CA-233914]|uniref:dipeptide ABC transporter ATP-binding protein n=1 Tax=Dactylosporangium sp. CA-233914 TaxID=3239934 RepID=UPI003D942DB0
MTEVVDPTATAPQLRTGAWRRLLRSPGMLIPALVLALMIIACFAAPLLGLVSPNATDPLHALSGPTAEHLLGTDSSGRDVLSRLLHGGQATLLAGLIATAVALVLGLPLGLVAGYYGGRIDRALNWVSSLVQALPAIVALLAVAAVIGSSPYAIMAVFGLLLLPAVFRPVRAAVIDVRRELYIDAAKVAGISDTSIVGRHILGVVFPVALIQTGFIFGVALIVQAGLEFIGIGDPTAASWGSMLQDGFSAIYGNAFLVVPPAFAIALTVLCLMLLASVGRDLTSESSTPSRRARRRVPAPGSDAPRGLLDVRDLGITYRADGKDAKVVEHVDFYVREGEILGLVGESGSGKTQSVLGVLGLLSAGGAVTNGTVLFDGRDITALSPKELNRLRGRAIGYIPQEPMSNLDPSFTIGSQITEPMRQHLRLSRAEAKRRALELLTRVGIVDPERTFRSYPHEISGGMAQRVLIAAAVSCEPRLIVADEPTTALDVTVQAEVLDLLRSLVAERGLATVLVTHDLGVVADMCDRVAVLRDGHVLERADVQQLFTQPQDPYTIALLDAMPSRLPPRDVAQRQIGEVVLEVERLQVSYPGPRGAAFVALDDVSLDVRRGETLGLVGESGSGKSTLGRAILGLAQATSGDIRWDGRSIVNASRAARRELSADIQVVFQDPFSSLNPAMSVEDILVEPLLSDPTLTRVQALQRVRGLLDEVHLPKDAGRRRAREFSGGQRQRIAIARALCRSPRLIICDEPVSALDLSTQARVLELFNELQDRTGVAYLFISHDLDVVRHIADRTAVIRHGRLVELGASEKIATDPADPYTRALAEASPLPDPVLQAERRKKRLESRMASL